jgi:hypothetical protein
MGAAQRFHELPAQIVVVPFDGPPRRFLELPMGRFLYTETQVRYRQATGSPELCQLR